MKKNLLFLLLISSFFGCKDDGCSNSVNLNVDKAQLALDIAAIDAYLDQNDIDAVEHPSGLRYLITNIGDGSDVSLCDNVVVDYKGSFLDGTEFQRSPRPLGLTMRNLITGWQIGIPLIKERGEIILYIPSVYAYGEQGSADIPKNSNLIFEIDLYVIQ